MTDEVKVEQIDREAADAAIESFEWQMANFMPAKGESGAACQNRRLREVMADALARHRLAARPAPAEDAVERVAKELKVKGEQLIADLADAENAGADEAEEAWHGGAAHGAREMLNMFLAAMQPRGEQKAAREEGR